MAEATVAYLVERRVAYLAETKDLWTAELRAVKMVVPLAESKAALRG